MAAVRELNLKPSFARELHGLPKESLAPLWEKISHLVEDPIADGKLKKKLRGHRDIYRLRVGDLRVFYTFGNTWVRLLAVRRRDERTYTDRSESVGYEEPSHTPSNADTDADLFEEEPPPRFTLKAPERRTSRVLPRTLDAEWLTSLKVPPKHLQTLVACETEEALLAAAIPAEVLARVVDNLYPRPLDQVLSQPDLVVRDPEDLARYREGSLVGFLLRLDPAQERYTRFSLRGPSLLRGGAGTGKSTVALYRVRALLDREDGAARVLFTTYTRALESVSAQLLEQLVGPSRMQQIRVATCDSLVWEIVSAQRTMRPFGGGDRLRALLRDVRARFTPEAASVFERKLRARSLDRLSDAYLLAEFEWIIEGRGLRSLDEYLAAPRPGRGTALGPKLREVLWGLYTAFAKRVASEGIETTPALRLEALAAVRSGAYARRFDHVLVDEAQDLSPVSLALLAELSSSAEGIFLAADAKQSIYARGFGFSDAHPRLQFKGRSATLTVNYRSTAEIDHAAFSVLRPEESETLDASESPHHGQRPVLARSVEPSQEPALIARFIRQMSSVERLPTHAAAVLVPTHGAGEAMARALSTLGIPCKFVEGREIDLRSPQTKVLTLHSAKGLEFPIVVLGGLSTMAPPTEGDFDDVTEFGEAVRLHRRLLYVAMTRAMRALMVVQPKNHSDPALNDLSTALWDVQEAL